MTQSYKIVPVDPSQNMIDHGELAAWDSNNSMPQFNAATETYKAMLAAAPDSGMVAVKRSDLEIAMIHISVASPEIDRLKAALEG